MTQTSCSTPPTFMTELIESILAKSAVALKKEYEEICDEVTYKFYLPAFVKMLDKEERASKKHKISHMYTYELG